MYEVKITFPLIGRAGDVSLVIGDPFSQPWDIGKALGMARLHLLSTVPGQELQ
jgi:hypothetical protein